MRLFIATTFPAEVLRAVNEQVTRVKNRLPSASWVRPESQHLTFAFLGEQDESLVKELESRVEANVARVRPFEARLHGCGFFPNPRHARVGWVGATPEEAFRSVADCVRASVREAGVELDGADFRPHLTLMRIRERWPPACIETFRTALGQFESDAFTVDRVILYSSELNPQGAIHTPLRQFPLG